MWGERRYKILAHTSHFVSVSEVQHWSLLVLFGQRILQTCEYGNPLHERYTLFSEVSILYICMYVYLLSCFLVTILVKQLHRWRIFYPFLSLSLSCVSIYINICNIVTSWSKHFFCHVKIDQVRHQHWDLIQCNLPITLYLLKKKDIRFPTEHGAKWDQN